MRLFMHNSLIILKFMARIIYSALVTQIRGSAGGTTFQQNKYGFTVKNKPNTIRPGRNNQNRSKNYLSTVTKWWRAIDDLGRLHWNTFAATFPQFAKRNPDAQLSGQAAFTKWHLAEYLQFGTAAGVETNPLTVVPMPDNAIIIVSRDGGALIMHFESQNGQPGWNKNFFISRVVQGSQVFVGSSLRYLISTSDDDVDFDITSQYITLFGRLPEIGDQVNFGVQFYTTVGGLVQATQILRIIVESA